MASNCSADIDTNQVAVTDQSGRLGQLSVVSGLTPFSSGHFTGLIVV
jgi:hypothetical protein